MLGGIAFVGLSVREPGTVEHEAEGRVVMGDPAGLTEIGLRVFALLESSWRVTLSDDIVHDQWHKLLWNAGFNASCAVTGATAGEALATPGSAALVRGAMEEVVAVAARHGVTLTPADVDEMAAPNPELRDATTAPPPPGTSTPASRWSATRCANSSPARAPSWVPTPINTVLDGLLALQEDRARRR